MFGFRVKFFILASFMFAFGISHSAYADLVVTASSHSDIKIGTKLPDNTRLRIPEDITIDILKTPENETYTLKGPFVGTLEDYKQQKKCKWYQRILGNCDNNSNDSTTGTVGGVRSIQPPSRDQ